MVDTERVGMSGVVRLDRETVESGFRALLAAHPGAGVSAIDAHGLFVSVPATIDVRGHPVLGARLRECFAVVYDTARRSALEIFVSPDDLKLRSCATLFDSVSAEDIFEQVINKYFDGERDDETLRLLRSNS